MSEHHADRPTTPTGSPAGEPTGPEGGPVDRPQATSPDPLRGSRTSGAWATLVALGIVLVLLVIFIAQNTQSVRVRFLGWDGTTPLAVALLIATAAGILITAIPGSLRIWQLRRRVRREAH